MGLFYAYLQDPVMDEHCRYLITFVNRESADEWWRMISAHPSPYAGHVKRISPQYYFQYDIYGNNIASFFNCAELPHAAGFREKMFFSPLSNRKGKIPTPIRPITITDHISGRWYFIRSKVDPWSHWYFSAYGACLTCGDANCDTIHVSSEHRTKFCIRVHNLADSDPQMPEDLVMIGRDEITITAPEGHTLHVDNTRNIKATSGYQGETDMLFGDLKNRFITRAEKRVNGEVLEYIVPVERGMGEVWELVD